MRSPTVMPDVWANDDGNFNDNIRLKSILKHELGHIFGVPHTISGLMDAKAPERLTSINLEPLDKLYQYTKPIFFPGSINIDVCDRKNYSILYQFFNVPEGNACVGIYSPVPNHGSFSGQVSHHFQGPDNMNVSAIISGSWNPSQTRFTEVHLISVPGFGINIIDSRFLELDGEQLIVSDGENSYIISEDGNPPAGGWTSVNYDCRYTKQP